MKQDILEIVESDALAGWYARSASRAPSLVFHLFNEKTFGRQHYSLCGNWFKHVCAPAHMQRFCKNCERIARAMHAKSKQKCPHVLDVRRNRKDKMSNDELACLKKMRAVDLLSNEQVLGAVKVTRVLVEDGIISMSRAAELCGVSVFTYRTIVKQNYDEAQLCRSQIIAQKADYYEAQDE